MNDRELVALLYMGLFIVFAAIARNVRPSLLKVLQLLVWSRLTFLVVLFITIPLAAIWLMNRLGFWTSSLLGSTLLWFILVGFVWFMNINEAGKDSDFFKRRLIESIGVVAFLEVFVGLVALPLWTEFVVQGLLLFVVLVNVYAQTDPKFHTVASITRVLLGIGGIGLFFYTLVTFIGNWNTQDWRDVLNQFFLPIWLTLVVLPVLYAVGFLAGYESLLLHLKFWNDGHRPHLRAVAGAAVELGGALVDISEFRGVRAKAAARATSFQQAREEVRAFKQERAARELARHEAQQRLLLYSDVAGTDEQGLQLDRREFAATKEALGWIATCHMGWYQRDDRPNTYRKDLLDMLGEFSRQGLPDPHEIIMRVRKDGQAWYAYRPTPSGHVFAIGASEGPPSQWRWDGGDPPPGFPSKKSGWTSIMDTDRPEWKAESEV